MDLADAIVILDYLFNEASVSCLEALDTNDDSTVDIADAVTHLTYFFGNGPAPDYPFPICGLDMTGTALGCLGPVASCAGGDTMPAGSLFPASIPPTFDAADRPISVALGDLDGDGDLDAVVANFESNHVSILINQGDGSYLPANQPKFVVGNGPRAVALGDLDGDGDLDACVANRNSNLVRVLINQEDDTLFPATTFLVGTNPESIALGDLDGDGDLDACVANSDTDNVHVLINQGNATFLPSTPPSYSVGDAPQDVVLGDLDGDGDLDACVANIGSDNVSTLINQGNGAFLPSSPPTFAAGNAPQEVALGDLDGDGDLDVCVANISSTSMSVLINLGDGTYLPPTSTAVGPLAASIALGDLDGDGDLDACVANFGTDVVSVLLNQGDGSFSMLTTFPVGSRPSSLALGDLDGDGDLDACVANQVSDNVSVLTNQIFP